MFTNKTKKSFQAVKEDVTSIKNSLHDWVLYLHEQNKMLQDRVEYLEQKMNLTAEEKRIKLEVYNS